MPYMCDAATCALPSILGNCSGTSHVDEICPWRFNAELTPSASGAAYYYASSWHYLEVYGLFYLVTCRA